MSPSLESLGAAALLLAWQADPAATYTIQTSPDLQNWESLPYVIHSVAGEAGFSVSRGAGPVYLRLRSSLNGDTNENGLPDLWEWSTFGRLDVSPLADADGDGLTNLEEWQHGTGAMDPLNGETPILYLTSGETWVLDPGLPSPYPLYLQAFHQDGSPWPGLEIRLSLDSGRNGLLRQLGNSTVQATSAILTTDALGKIGRFNEDIRVLALSETDRYERLLIHAGPSEASVLLVTREPAGLAAPQNLNRIATAEGGWYYTWKGDPAAADSFIIEEEQPDGSWARVVELPCSDMPAVNTGTGNYSLVVGPASVSPSTEDKAS